jgi:Leucine-rich repeat (LRR) protein
LSLDFNQISDLTPLQSLKNLTWLSLSGNKISDLTPLQVLNHLTQLKIRDNPLPQELVDALQRTLPDCEISF